MPPARRWQAALVGVLVLAMLGALVLAGVQAQLASMANACQSAYLNQLSDVLVIRARVGDVVSAAQVAEERAIVASGDNAAVFASAHRQYLLVIEHARQIRAANPLPPEPDC